LKPESLKELQVLYNAMHFEFMTMVRAPDHKISIYTLNLNLLKADVTATSL